MFIFANGKIDSTINLESQKIVSKISTTTFFAFGLHT